MNHKQKSNNSSALTNAAGWFLLTLIILLPIIAVPLTLNLFGHSKIFLLCFGAIITALLYFFQSFKTRVWKVVVSPITLPLLLFGLTAAASTFFTQNYPIENLLGMGGVYLASTVVALLAPSIINKQNSSKAVIALIAGACLVTLASLFQLFGWGPSHIINAVSAYEVEHSLVFNLAGSSLVALQLGVLALIGVVAKIIKEKKVTTFDVFAIPLLTLGIGLHVWSMLPGQPAQLVLPPLGTSWSIVLDSLRVPRAAIIGQGPGGYANTFLRYRPAALNINRYWQMVFNSAMGMPLTVVVQLGLLGLATWLMLAFRFITKVLGSVKSANNPTNNKQPLHDQLKQSPLSWVILSSFIMQFFLQPSFLMIGLQGILIAFWTAELSHHFTTLNLHALSANLDKDLDKEKNGDTERFRTHPSDVEQVSQQQNQAEKIISLGTNGALVAGLLLLAYAVGQAYASFNHLYQAEKALMENNAVAVYEHQQKAVTLNPSLDSTRRTYALTNLQIALALSNKTDISEQEQAQVSSLLEQAVREAQAATTIDPQDSQNWSVLAQIYQQLIGSVDEADQWAVNAYVSAIQTSPSDPLLRIQLGTILMQQEQLQQAANLFSQATELKPDLPSGYFYLGQVQRAAQDPISAQRSWQQALALLEPGTEDYDTLEQLLAELEPEVKQMEEAIAAQQEQAQQAQQAQENQMGGGQMESGELETGDNTSPLGQQLPSLTNQNIERPEDSVSQPSSTQLDLSEEDLDLINQSNEDGQANEEIEELEEESQETDESVSQNEEISEEESEEEEGIAN